MKLFLFGIVVIGTLIIAGKQKATDIGSIFVVFVTGFAILSLIAQLPDQERTTSTIPHSYSGTTSYTTTNYSAYGGSSYSRERALTKEEADRLRGTGYHNTRPNSAAEHNELKAAQVTCKECGYHSDNGYNSLCDYCQAHK